jgi:NitT/TauT family transport system substrate-binding protein
MKTKRLAVFFVVAVIVGIAAVIWIGYQQPRKHSGGVEKIRLGVSTPDASALIYIADRRGFFRDYGLDLSTKNYEAGVLAMNDLMADEIDITMIAEFVLVNQIFKGTDLKAFGTTVITNSCELIARKDRGIEKVADLKEKKIGSVRGTNLDFFLGTFLTSHGIRMRDVKVINLKPTEIVDSILKGTIDGGASFVPYSDTIRKNMGTNAITWPIQGQQDFYMLLVAKTSFVKTYPSRIERLLRALIDAEQFIKEHETEAQKIIAERSNLDLSTLFSIWPKSRFEVRLDQDLVILMEHEARWAMRNKLTGSTRVPNYLDFIYIDGLQKIKPEAVTIIH